ncbi:unnamed protein product [Sphagnum balticum]
MIMTSTATILWFRQDLRLSDNPALLEAVAKGAPIIPLYIYSDHQESWPMGAAQRWWLHYSLEELAQSLEKMGAKLVLRRGQAQKVLRELIDEVGADAVFWNRCYEPYAIKRDTAIKEQLKKDGIQVESFNASLLYEPWEVQNKSGKPFQVFTFFWKAALALRDPLPPKTTKAITSPGQFPKSETLASFELLPTIDWAKTIQNTWKPGEAGAQERLKDFLKTAVFDYLEGRNRPDFDGVSRLSPYLHFGEISPRQCWQAVKEALDEVPPKQRADAAKNVEVYLRELGWREFGYHLLYHFPETTHAPLHKEYQNFPWMPNDRLLKAWQKGRTGFPMVDAGMRQLWATGWMHNRVRMIVASFLVKDLLINWVDGAEWFWDTLLDADLASNSLGWQWAAGCGADAAPYFRVFNPITQGQKFDPDGQYVRKWVPELSKLSSKWIHEPWKAPPLELQAAGVELGENYPEPIVDHAQARIRALAALKAMKEDKPKAAAKAR